MANPRLDRLVEKGRALRAQVPREAHAEWAPAPDRPDPMDILERQAATRVPELVPIRYGRMADSPFAFFRGAAAIMASDLARTPASGIRVQACGDAHLVNFGVFASPDRRLVFDLNDFDETLPAPFEWDLKRLAASVAAAARHNGLSRPDQRAIVRATVREYQGVMAAMAQMPFLAAWYARLEAGELIKRLGDELAESGRQARRTAEKAERRTNLGTLDKLTAKVDGRFRIKSRPPVIVGVPRGQRRVARELVDDALRGYVETLAPERRIVLGHYRQVDVARKVSGVGSVGTEGYFVLLMGQRDDDPLWLQFKEAQESVLAPYAGQSEYAAHGERVVRGQRVMQAAGDSFLGWYDAPAPIGKAFYIRQLRDKKGAADPTGASARRLAVYCRLCGACLARAHGRSDEIARLSGYVGTGKPFARAIERFALAYADQNERDYRALLDAEREGRITLRRGV
jgi:uncharacterized protein (DUF2252 family)